MGKRAHHGQLGQARARPGSALTCLMKEGKLEKINIENVLIV